MSVVCSGSMTSSGAWKLIALKKEVSLCKMDVILMKKIL